MKIVCVDLFCGAGGASAGLVEAAQELGLEIELIAINHWPVAIATHSANYPWARHICARIDQVRPRDVVPGGRVHLLIAGPECTHHSIARGGRPVDDQKRVPAWGVLPWLADLYVENLIIENVPEFRGWAPLGADGKPLKSHKGETYQAFLQAIRSHAYNLAEEIICVADYGDFTSRKRLFIQAVRRGLPTFPPPTHSQNGGLFTERWRTARSIIDWDLIGESIFGRRKPLVAKTLRRIAAGMLEFNGIDITPFLENCVADTKKRNPRSLDRSSQSTSQSTNLVEGVPFLIAAGGPEGKGRHPKSVEHPLRTVLTENHEAIIRPFLVVVNHGDPKTASGNRVEDGNSGNSARCYSVEKPIPTVTCKNGYGIVHAFLTKYYGTSVKAQSVEDPLDAVTTRDRFALVEPTIVAGPSLHQHNGELSVPLIPLGNNLYLDIRFRMLQWHELAGAQGFPKEYIFTGNKSTKVKQIGNAVPRYAAKALCRERLKSYVPRLPLQPSPVLMQAVC